MNSIDSLMRMICTEAVFGTDEEPLNPLMKKVEGDESKKESFEYKLELVANPNGTLDWKE